MEQLLAKHPDLKEILINNPAMKSYKVLSTNNKVLEYWEKDKDGHWIDVTEREKLKERIAAEQEEIEKLRRKKVQQDDKGVE